MEIEKNKQEGGQLPACCREKEKFSFKKLAWPLIILVIFSATYLVLKSSGAFEALSFLNEKNIGYGLIFLIGALASFHCVGMCGGFIMAYSTTITNYELHPPAGGTNYKLHLQYNLGRLISYTAAGGIFGGLGSVLNISPAVYGIILILAGTIMVIFGTSIATNLFKIRLPQFIYKIIWSKNSAGKTKAPFIIGLLTIFVPCGPLAAMELYSLSTGSALIGALSMFFFAAGTIPVLFGFGAFVSSLSSERIKGFFKISGVIIMLLGILTISRGVSGLAFSPASPADKPPIENNSQKYQSAEMTIDPYGFKPNVIKIKKGVPVRFTVHNKGATGCTNAIIIYNGKEEIKKNINAGDTIIEFTPANQAEIKISCWMRMVWGKFIIE